MISKYGFHILPLSEALDKLQRNMLPNNALVITVDDGFYSFYHIASDLMRFYRYPATIYLTTYYVQKEKPIFRLVVQYMFWKTQRSEIDLHSCVWSNQEKVDLTDRETRNRATWDCIDYGEQKCSEVQREDISRQLGELLGVDYQKIKDSRILSLMNEEEVRTLAKYDFDIQLHTHRHQLCADDENAALREIQENKQVIRSMVNHPLVHFCYPSGIWNKRQWPWLECLGVKSAVTCLPGLNDTNTPALILRRFLDGEDISQIEFISELFGFSEFIRYFRNRFAHNSVQAGINCE